MVVRPFNMRVLVVVSAIWSAFLTADCVEDSHICLDSALQGDGPCSLVDTNVEAVSLVQVNAIRLEKAAATSQNATAAARESDVHATNASMKASLLEIVNKGVGTLSTYLFGLPADRGDGVIIVLVVIIIICAICLMVISYWQPNKFQQAERLESYSSQTYLQPQPARAFKPAPDRTYLNLQATEIAYQSNSQNALSLPTSQLRIPTSNSPTSSTGPRIVTQPYEIPNSMSMGSVDLPVANSVLKRPPPISSTVLSCGDLFFALPIDRLINGENSVEILGLSGVALWRSTVKDTSEGRVLEVSMASRGAQPSPPMASIREAAEDGPAAGMKELKMCKGTSATHYGWLRPCARGELLQCGGDDLIEIVPERATGSFELYACSNGEMLAQASRSSDGETMFNAEDLEVRVAAKMDGVVVLLCVLSMIVFQ